MLIRGLTLSFATKLEEILKVQDYLLRKVDMNDMEEADMIHGSKYLELLIEYS